MSTKPYSDDFKAAVVKKMLLPGSPGPKELSSQLGISRATLYSWAKKYANPKAMNSKNPQSPQKWPVEKKLQAIIETSQLSGTDLGEYLRQHGLHSSDLEDWKQQFIGGFKTAGRPKLDPELWQLRKELKSSQRDLKRKDRALAEMSARIVLLKKSRLIWGDSEEDE